MNGETSHTGRGVRTAVRRLGYMEIGVSDLEAWRHFGRDVLACMVIDDPQRNRLLLRLDEYAFRIVVQGGGDDDLVALGWEMNDSRELDRLATTLRAEGKDLLQEQPASPRRHEVAGLAVFADRSGLLHEIYCGPTICHQAPYNPPRAHAGFQTGDQGLGHVFLAVDDAGESTRLYEGLLGLRLTDTVNLERDGRRTPCSFMRCNPRHHSLAFGEVGGGKRLQHMMLQTNDLDDVGRTLDIAKRAGVRQRRELGRHSNDCMVSFYMDTPSGFQIECGWGAIEIDESRWSTHVHNVTSKWGHQRVQERNHAWPGQRTGDLP